MTATRRLAAVVAADVAGYSRLIGDGEEGTLNRLRAIRTDVIDPKISEYRGRIAKTTGDGLLAQFTRVVNALRCATKIQTTPIEGRTRYGDAAGPSNNNLTNVRLTRQRSALFQLQRA
jgi:class 3 adenylate cyclase